MEDIVNNNNNNSNDNNRIITLFNAKYKIAVFREQKTFLQKVDAET